MNLMEHLVPCLQLLAKTDASLYLLQLVIGTNTGKNAIDINEVIICDIMHISFFEKQTREKKERLLSFLDSSQIGQHII